MGFEIGPEILYGVGTVILLAVLIYVASIAGRGRRSGSTKTAADAATRRNFDKA